MFEIRTEIRIDASAERVYRALTEFAEYPDWNPLIKEIKGSPREGETIKARFLAGGILIGFSAKVTVAEHDREFGWVGGLRYVFRGEHRFVIEPLAEGGVLLVQSERFTGFMAPLLRPVLERFNKPHYAEVDIALKHRAGSLLP